MRISRRVPQVRKHRDRATGAWKQISKQRRRVDVSYDPSMIRALRYGGTWIDEERFKKTCIKEKKKKGGIYQLFYSTWVADFMPRQDAGKFMLGRYLSDKQIPWRRRRRLGMAVAGITRISSQLTKIGKTQSAGCQCRLRRDGNDSYGSPPLHLEASVCMLHKSQKACSSMSPLTKKVT